MHINHEFLAFEDAVNKLRILLVLNQLLKTFVSRLEDAILKTNIIALVEDTDARLNYSIYGYQLVLIYFTCLLIDISNSSC